MPGAAATSYGIQMGPYVASAGVFPQMGVMHLSIREVAFDADSVAGLLNDSIYGRDEHVYGFIYAQRRTKVDEDDFDEYEAQALHRSKETAAPVLAQTWHCTLTYPTELVAATLRLKAAPKLGNYIEEAKAGAGTTHPVSKAVVHKNGTV